MTRSRFARLTAFVTALLVTAVAAGQQSDNEARRENQRLRTQVQDLERELDAARNQIDELERQIEGLRRMLEEVRRGGSTTPSTQPQPPVSIDESVPNASPRALIAALVESYNETTEDLEMARPGDRDRVAYVRALEKWASRVNRELKSQIVWHVRVVTAPWNDERDPRLELLAVDPETKTVLGEPFHAQAPRTMLRRIEMLERRGELDVLLLKGVVMPNVRINTARDAAGAFDRPRFIGPFAECELRVAVASVSLPDEDDPGQERRQP
jgi:hypothetical protein